MPILRGAVTFSRFQAEAAAERPRDLKASLSKGLRARAFTPIERRSDEDRAAGFVELEQPDATEFPPGSFLYGEWALFAYRVDQLKIPGGELRAQLAKWSLAFERDKGRAPSRVERAQGREAVKGLLRAHTTPRTRLIEVSWNLKTDQLLIWSTSRRAVDEVQEAMRTAFGLNVLAKVPAAAAEKLGAKTLRPTVELCGPELQGEVSDE